MKKGKKEGEKKDLGRDRKREWIQNGKLLNGKRYKTAKLQNSKR